MMKTPTTRDRRGGSAPIVFSKEGWRSFESGKAYRCRVLVNEEDDGGFSVFALRLPGTISQGDTFDEAIANIRDALAGSIRTYMEMGRTVPWKDVDVDDRKNSEERWILVNV